MSGTRTAYRICRQCGDREQRQPLEVPDFRDRRLVDQCRT
jgi:hypothetical protein